MARSRLSAFLAEETLPEGGILALRPRPGGDLALLPRDRVTVETGFWPDRAAFEEAGWRVAEEAWAGQGGPTAALAHVTLPRSKALARALVAEAAARAPVVLLDGAREDGVDAMWSDLRLRRPEADLWTLGHGRLIRFAGGSGFEDWALPAPALADGLWTRPGVFGEGGPDRGSVMLAEALPARLPARMADLGAGVGTLARAALSREGVESIQLVEAEALALGCARLNVPDPRASFLWADATRATLGPFDGIVMNPPFHVTRTPDPALGRAFIAAAARALAPSGTLWMVANRHLPYEEALSEAFREVEALGGDAAFRLVRAAGPRAAGAKGARGTGPARPGARPAARSVVRRRR